MMISRELPHAEWFRLKGTELEDVWPVLDPADARIIVVEDDHGEIIGCWSLLRYWHAEGVWVHPDHRKRVSVARRLLTSMRRLTRSCGARAVITGANTHDVRHLLTTHLKATALPGEAYVWPVR